MTALIHTVSGDEASGISITHDLRKTAHAVIKLAYTGRFVPPGFGRLEIECEIYKAGNILSVHTVCPKCRNSQWIDGRNKHIEYDKDRGVFVEPFVCSWEAVDDFGLCNLAMVYDGKTAREV